jgi:Tfp pilus assembly protein PilF
MKVVKRTLLYGVVVGLMLAAGCGRSTMNQDRQRAQKHWAESRAEMATNLAQGCYNRGEFARANEHIDELIRQNVPYAPMYVLAARLAAERGDLDTAGVFARNAQSLDPSSAEACYVLGTIEQTLGHNDAALAEFTEAAAIDPAQARYVLARAELLVSEGLPVQAAQVLNEAISQMPGRGDLQAALGDVLSTLKRHAEAVGCYRIALRLAPDQADVKERLAVALFYSGAYAEAETALADLDPFGKDPTPAWVACMRAECFMALGRVAQAREAFEVAAKVHPALPAAVVGLAKCDILENRLPSAHKFLDQVLARDARHAEGNALMGYVLVAEGHPGEAVPHLELALGDPKLADRAAIEKLLNLARSRLERRTDAAAETPDVE